jgi:hypothetical protein
MQLFNLAEDPDELNDLSGSSEQASRIADLRQKLLTWLKENGDPNLDAIAATPNAMAKP